MTSAARSKSAWWVGTRGSALTSCSCMRRGSRALNRASRWRMPQRGYMVVRRSAISQALDRQCGQLACEALEVRIDDGGIRGQDLVERPPAPPGELSVVRLQRHPRI